MIAFAASCGVHNSRKAIDSLAAHYDVSANLDTTVKFCADTLNNYCVTIKYYAVGDQLAKIIATDDSMLKDRTRVFYYDGYDLAKAIGYSVVAEKTKTYYFRNGMALTRQMRKDDNNMALRNESDFLMDNYYSRNR